MTHTKTKNKIQIDDLNKIMDYVKSLKFDKEKPLKFDKQKREAAFCLLENCKTRVEGLKDKLIYELNLELKENLEKEALEKEALEREALEREALEIKEREALEKGREKPLKKLTRYQQVKACLKQNPLKVTYDYSGGYNNTRKYVLFKKEDDGFKKLTKNSKASSTYGRGYFSMIKIKNTEKLHLIAFHHDDKTPPNAPKNSYVYDVRISEKGIFIID